MTSILADHQYDLRHFPGANILDINAILSETIINNINRLASRVGAPTYQKTPVFMKRDKQHRRPPRASKTSYFRSRLGRNKKF